MPVTAGFQDRREFGPWRSSIRPLLRWVLLLAGVATLSGLTPSILAAQEWHELYADGEKALRDGQPQRATSLFLRAIQKRSRPGLAVPTYGTNFEPRYFPYLRLAEAYLRLELPDEALKHLETSARLDVEPASERAVLEARARAALASRNPVPESVPPPAPIAPAPPPVAPPDSTRPNAKPAPDSMVPSPATPAPSVPSARPVDPVRRPSLELTSDPPGARVFVDDEPVGRTDAETGRLRLTSLAPGRHRLRFSSEGHDDLVRDITLGDGPLTFHGALSRRQTPPQVPTPADPPGRSPPLPSWPWIALLLVVGTAIVLVWLRPRSRHRSQPARPSPVRSVSSGGSLESFPIQFGDYRLLRRIGKGGMAVVYEAERREERFALKRPLDGYLEDPKFLERFVREADLGRALHHPNIIRIFDRGQIGRVPYFAMELLDGETLAERLDRDGHLDPIVATGIVARVAEALDYAHHKGVIHRDLKPSNIMLERSGGVKVMDYGIARAQHLDGVTVSGQFVGTPQYAAPEALESGTEPRSDLYSLGVVFFEMLTGSQPFTGENALAVLHQHGFAPPPAPSSVNAAVPAPLDRIVIELLGKQPSSRPTAEALLNRLADYLEAGR